MAVAPGTGNHKGCPYDGFAGAYFHGWRRERATTRVAPNGFAGAYFHGWRRERATTRVAPNGFAEPIFMGGAGNGQPQGLPLRRVCRSLFSWLAPGTGNHKGCPYNGFAGAYFHSKPAPTNQRRPYLHDSWRRWQPACAIALRRCRANGVLAGGRVVHCSTNNLEKDIGSQIRNGTGH